MTKIVFMGTPEFALPSLQQLMQMYPVVGVVTQPDKPSGRGQQVRPSPIKQLALSAGIPIYQPNSLRSETAAAPLRQWQPDLIVVAAFGQILRPHVLDLPPMGCLNVHASLLPRWRGASPIQHALLAGDTTTGITLMRMDVGMDTGPCYVQQAIPIQPQETAATLHDRLAHLGADLLAAYLPQIMAGALPPTPQDETLATPAPLIEKKDGRLDWSRPAHVLDRQIRAMTPWPGAFTLWQGESIKILTAQPVPLPLPGGRPGLVSRVAEQIVVYSGDGALALQMVQLAGKRPLPIHDFVNGRPDFIGSTLTW